MWCRELYGRGLISWAKGTSWFQSLQEAQRRAEVAAAAQCPSASTVKVQVEQLSGQVLLLEVEVDARLAELKLAIQQRLGVLAEQQRVIVLGDPPHLTNMQNSCQHLVCITFPTWRLRSLSFSPTLWLQTRADS